VGQVQETPPRHAVLPACRGGRCSMSRAAASGCGPPRGGGSVSLQELVPQLLPAGAQDAELVEVEEGAWIEDRGRVQDVVLFVRVIAEVEELLVGWALARV